MKEKDITEKILEDYNDVFADIVNVLLFEGEQVVTPESLQDTSVKSQYKADDSRIHEQERDAAKYWLDGDVKISLYGLENQTVIDNDIPVRLMGYDGSSYRSQLLSGAKERYPIVSIVLYYGKRHWKNPLTLKESINIPKQLEPYVNDYKINLFEISWLTDEQVKKFQSDFKIVADLFVQKRKNNSYHPSSQVIRHVDEVLKFLSIMTDDERYLTALQSDEVRQKKGVIDMCSIVDSFIDQGIEKGKEQSKREIAANLLSMGLPRDQIARALNVSPEALQKLLDLCNSSACLNCYSQES